MFWFAFKQNFLGRLKVLFKNQFFVKKHLKYSALFLVGFLLAACSSPTDDTVQTPTSYYDLKGFIAHQITELKKRKPLVTKQMSVGETSESTQTTDIDWGKELDLFAQADLNKKAYLLSYDTANPDPNTLVYTLKKGEKLPVKLLKITLDATHQKPARVEAQLSEDNQLYDSAKTLTLTATMRPEGIWMVKTYEISGFQHLALTDKKAFRVTGTIR
jgi:hypothetical protein